MDTVIRTLSGRRFDFRDPMAYPYAIEEIAAVLARIGRFNNHTRDHYSVAQHSVLVADIVLQRTGRHDIAYQGLMHDAAEAFAHDLVAPLKALVKHSRYGRIERAIEDAIAMHFGLPIPLDAEIKRADSDIVWAEIRDLMNHDHDAAWWPEFTVAALDARVRHETLLHAPIIPLAADAARDLFLQRHADLVRMKTTPVLPITP